MDAAVRLAEALASPTDGRILGPQIVREKANMGISTFHHAFTDATATSPLQYVKSIRLHKARTLLLADGVNAQDAARRVGYASASQFSREYRRMFGCSPASDRAAVPA